VIIPFLHAIICDRKVLSDVAVGPPPTLDFKGIYKKPIALKSRPRWST
jgi:hypothetical protein